MQDNEQNFEDLLHRITSLESVSHFGALYYHAIAERLEPPENTVVEHLRETFSQFMNYELQFHRRLNVLAEADSIDVGEVVALVDKRHIGLHDIIDRVQAIDTARDRDAATVELLIGECYYQLEQFTLVTSHIERALQLGADEPIFHFALGYNRYLLAEKAFTGLDDDTGEVIVLDENNYRSTLLDAVTAFQQALSGGPFDEDLYWWIGTCLERAEFENAARHAFKQAEELTDGEEGAVRPEGAMERQEDDRHSQQLPQITLAEIRRARQELNRSFTVAEILGEGDQ